MLNRALKNMVVYTQPNYHISFLYAGHRTFILQRMYSLMINNPNDIDRIIGLLVSKCSRRMTATVFCASFDCINQSQ